MARLAVRMHYQLAKSLTRSGYAGNANPSFRLEDFQGIKVKERAIARWWGHAMKFLAAEHELLRGVVGLQISVRKYDDVTILDLRGRSTIVSGESELLSSHLREMVTNGVRKLLLNLANLTQVDSSGVGIIVETCVTLRKRGGDLRLLCPRGRVLEVLTMFRLLEAIPSFENEAQAVASFV